jgi:hypothetical protein
MDDLSLGLHHKIEKNIGTEKIEFHCHSKKVWTFQHAQCKGKIEFGLKGHISLPQNTL